MSSRLISRAFSSAVGHNATEEAGKTAEMWKKVFYFVALPCLALAHLNVYLMTKEEHENFQRPPFVKYEYLRVRTKRYPWGDGTRTLFHNPHVNALPDGYEDEH